MSTISNNHVVNIFDAKYSKPLEDCRLAKIGYKFTKGMKESERKTSKCVSVPKVNKLSEEFISEAQGYIVEWFEGKQDEIIRGLIEQGKDTINTADIDENAVLTFLSAEQESARITKEKIFAWFDSSIAEDLYIVFGTKICGADCDTPSEAQVGLINKNLNVYKEKFGSLASGATKYPQQIVEQMLKALEYSDGGDEMANRLVKRLEDMNKASEQVLEML